MENLKRKTGPKKILSATIVSLYLLANFIFMIVIFGNMPLLKDTIDMTNHQTFNTWFNQYYIFFAIVLGTLQIACIVYCTYTLATKSWPSLLAYVISILCTTFSYLTITCVYTLDLRHVFSTFQILFVLPIIFIFTSTVFLTDDTFDLMKGTYYSHVSKMTAKAQKRLERDRRKIRRTVISNKGETVENKEKEEISLPHTQSETLDMHRQRISTAAENALPFSESSNDSE